MIISRLPLSVIFVFFLSTIAGCESEESNSSNTNNTGSAVQLNPGGTAAAPSQMRLDIPNEISSDQFENYFNITVMAGDTLVINTTFINPMDSSANNNCQVSGSDFISMNTESYRCAAHLKQQFTSDGVYTFHFSDALNNSGFFDAALISDGQSFTASSGATGRPDDPRAIILGGVNNSLSSNSFYNNFVYDAQAGETLQIQTYPDTSPSVMDNNICQIMGRDFEAYRTFGVLINDSRYNCSESFEHQFDQAGQYHLNIRFLHGVEGYFRAVVF
jgi:hypothetical protein